MLNKKLLKRALSAVLTSAFFICTISFSSVSAAGAQAATVTDKNPAVKDCDAKLNLFGSNPGVEGEGWWKDSYNWNNGVISLDTTVKHSGKSSIIYSAPVANWDLGMFAPDIAVKANTEYTFSFWVMGGTKGDVFGCMLTGNDKIGDFTLNPASWDSTWHQVGYTFNTGDHTVIRFHLGSGGGTAYFDDFQLFEVTGSAKDIPVEEKKASIVTMNPTATNCADSDNLFGTHAGAESDTWWKDGWNWSCGAYTRTRDTKHSGEYSIKYSQETANWDNAFFAPDFQVQPNTDYTFSVWVKGERQGDAFVVMLTGNDKIGGEYLLAPKQWNNSWHQVAYTFNTGKHTSIRMSFGSGGGTVYYDDFKLFPASKGTVPPPVEGVAPEGRRQVYHNITCKDDKNLITDSGCESELYWKNDSQGYGKALTVSSEKPYEGEKGLKFAANGDNYIKWVDVSPNTDYYLSMMLSADPAELGNIQYYLVDSNGVQIENVFTPEQAANYVLRGGVDTVLNIPSWDGFWYNRINCFNTGRENKIGIKLLGTKGILFLDNIKLFKKDDAFNNDEASGYGVTLEINPEKSFCADSDNLVKNGNFNEGDKDWSGISGFGNFLTVDKIAENNVLYYKGTQSNAYFMSWFDVEPNKEYTLSYYAQVLKPGDGEIGIFEGSKKMRNIGEQIVLNEASGWKQYSVTFMTENLDKIAFYVYDGSGEAAIDKIRLFETAKGDIPSASDVPAGIPVDSESKAASPATGDVGLFTAITGLVASSAGIAALRLRKKKK